MISILGTIATGIGAAILILATVVVIGVLIIFGKWMADGSH